MVQEAYLRALRYFDGFRGSDARAWLLKIVRNTCYSWLRQRREEASVTEFNEDLHSGAADSETPEASALRSANREMVRQALEELPAEYREIIVLRELEGLDYKAIAEIAEIPVGTVMSRLSRARRKLRERLADAAGKGAR